jgi:hypothetical protein
MDCTIDLKDNYAPIPQREAYKKTVFLDIYAGLLSVDGQQISFFPNAKENTTRFTRAIGILHSPCKFQYNENTDWFYHSFFVKDFTIIDEKGPYKGVSYKNKICKLNFYGTFMFEDSHFNERVALPTTNPKRNSYNPFYVKHNPNKTLQCDSNLFIRNTSKLNKIGNNTYTYKDSDQHPQAEHKEECPYLYYFDRRCSELLSSIQTNKSYSLALPIFQFKYDDSTVKSILRENHMNKEFGLSGNLIDAIEEFLNAILDTKLETLSVYINTLMESKVEDMKSYVNESDEYQANVDNVELYFWMCFFKLRYSVTLEYCLRQESFQSCTCIGDLGHMKRLYKIKHLVETFETVVKVILCFDLQHTTYYAYQLPTVFSDNECRRFVLYWQSRTHMMGQKTIQRNFGYKINVASMKQLTGIHQSIEECVFSMLHINCEQVMFKLKTQEADDKQVLTSLCIDPEHVEAILNSMSIRLPSSFIRDSILRDDNKHQWTNICLEAFAATLVNQAHKKPSKQDSFAFLQKQKDTFICRDEVIQKNLTEIFDYELSKFTD